MQLVGGAGLEDAVVAHFDALHAALPQRLRHGLALDAGADEDRDIAASQRPAVQRRATVTGGVQQCGDFRRGSVGGDGLKAAPAGYRVGAGEQSQL